MDSLHNIEKDLNAAFSFVLKSAKVDNAGELNQTVMTKMHKGPLINCVEKLFGLLKSNIELCRSAAGKIDRLQADCIQSKSELIALQQNKLDTVQTSVRKEMQSWSDIVQKNCEKSSVPAVKGHVKQVVKSFVEESDRSRSFIIYGAKEEKAEHTPDLVDDLLLAINEENKHQVLGSLRIGTIKKDSDSVRPIKVTLGSADSVKEILSKAKTLKTLYGSYAIFSKMYLAPDRSREERIEHRKLVEEMKLLISKEPSKHHCIRNGKIVSVLRD